MLDRVDRHRLHARDVGLYGGALRADELALAYAPLQLLAGHLSELDVTGLRIQLSEVGGELMLGGTPLRASPPSTGGSPIGALRVDAVRLDEAWLALDRPGGRLEAGFSGRLAWAGAGLRDASLSVDASVPIAGERRALRVVVSGFALSPQPEGGVRLELADAKILPGDLPWAAEGIHGDLVWRAGQAAARIAVDRVTHLGHPALIEPVRLNGAVGLAEGQLDFTLHAETEAAGAKGRLGLDATGRHDRATHSGHASIATTPAVFRPEGLQPAQLFPVLGGRLPELAGSVAASGSVSWVDSALSCDLAIRLGELSFESSAARFRRIRGDVHLAGLWPPRTPPDQVLRGVVEAGGLPPSDVVLAFQLLASPALRVQSIQAGIAGGRLSTSPFTIDLATRRLDTVLKVEQVDLAEVFTLIGIDGLGGTGRLDGSLPLRFAAGRLRIHEGTLAASGPGVLRLRREELPQAGDLAAAGASVQSALEALRDFHYDVLTLGVDENAAGEGTVLLRLEGNNPAVLEGRPFHFHIRLESNFDRLRDLALRAMTAAQTLLRRSAEGLSR